MIDQFNDVNKIIVNHRQPPADRDLHVDPTFSCTRKCGECEERPTLIRKPVPGDQIQWCPNCGGNFGYASGKPF